MRIALTSTLTGVAYPFNIVVQDRQRPQKKGEQPANESAPLHFVDVYVQLKTTKSP